MTEKALNPQKYDRYDFKSKLTFTKKCPFCGHHPVASGGYEFGKVSCQNIYCNISNVHFYMDEWNARASG